MNGLDKITQRIEQDAQAAADQVLSEARAKADGIRASWEEKARRESEEILSRGKRNAEERVERLASVAQLEARKLELAAKQDMLGRAFDLALEKLQQLPDDQYVALLADLAARAAFTGKEQVLMSEKDRARVGGQVIARANELLAPRNLGMLTLAEETRPMQGGLILSDGDVEVNCSFETLIRLQRGALEQDVARVLFD